MLQSWRSTLKHANNYSSFCIPAAILHTSSRFMCSMQGGGAWSEGAAMKWLFKTSSDHALTFLCGKRVFSPCLLLLWSSWYTDTHANWNLLITLSKKKLTYIGGRAKNNSRQSYNFNCVQSTANVTLQSNRLKSWWSKQRSWREEEPGRVAVKPLRAVKMGKEVWHIFCSGRPSRHCSSTACSCWNTYWMFALLRICWGLWCGQYHCWPFQGGRSGTKESA